MTTATRVHTADEWRERYKQQWALATDRFEDGVYRMPRERAFQHRYIETGPSALTVAIVVDVDHEDAVLRAFEQPSNHAKPSWVAVGPTGRAHAGWWLNGPVARTDAARQAPLRYLARTTEGLRKSLDGDPSYTSLLTRCPVAPDAEVIWGEGRAYELRELQTPFTPRQLPRKPERSHGFGRNCSMFDAARHEVYGLHDPEQPFEDWHRIVLQHCHAANAMFAEPLPFAEVSATASSIARWTRKNFISKSEYQAKRGMIGGTKSGEVRRAKRAARIAAMLGEGA